MKLQNLYNCAQQYGERKPGIGQREPLAIRRLLSELLIYSPSGSFSMSWTPRPQSNRDVHNVPKLYIKGCTYIINKYFVVL